MSGPDALQLVPVFQPDVILLDLWLPQMQGDEVLEQLRQAHPQLPVVIVSANRDLEIARGMLAKGAFDYVPKPFDLPVLERIVAAPLVRSGARRDEYEDQRPRRRDGRSRGVVLYIEDNPSNVPSSSVS